MLFLYEFKIGRIEVLSQFSRSSGVEMRILKSKMKGDLDVRSRNDSFQMKQLMDEKCAIIHSKITESVTSFEFWTRFHEKWNKDCYASLKKKKVYFTDP